MILSLRRTSYVVLAKPVSKLGTLIQPRVSCLLQGHWNYCIWIYLAPQHIEALVEIAMVLLLWMNIQDILGIMASIIIGGNSIGGELKMNLISMSRRFEVIMTPISRTLKLKMKDWIRRPEGDEWEPIKISRRNLAYVPNKSQQTSLLTRSRPHSYSKAIGPQNRVRNARITVEHKLNQANPRLENPPTSHEKRRAAAWIKKQSTTPHKNSCHLTCISPKTSHALVKNTPK
jgi:hypothetical protein